MISKTLIRLRGQIVITMLLTLLVLGLRSGPVSAHVLKTDGDFHVELHIKPHDHPLSNTPVHYEISFEEAPEGFSLTTCNCQVRITNGSDVTIQKTLTTTSADLSENVVTFPKPGNYSVQVSGSPKNAGSFPAFSLRYPVTVGNGAPPKQSFSPLLAWGIGIAIGGIVLVALLTERSKGAKIPTE